MVVNDDKQQEILQEWYKLRRRTMVIGVLHKSLFTFDFSAISISGLYYYRYTINAEDPELYFSISLASIFVTAFFSSVVAGPYIDRTGNLRNVVLVTNLITVLGDLLYVVSYSKWLPIIGRALFGISQGAVPGFAGDMARCYSKNDLAGILSTIQLCGGILYALAPCTPAIIRNFTFLGLEINQYNGVALVIAMIMVVFEVLAYFFLTDLTKHPGYKIWLRDATTITTTFKNNNNNNNNNNKTRHKKAKIFSAKDIFTDFDILAVLVGNFYVTFSHSLVETSVFIVAVIQFKWNLATLSIVSSICMAACVIVMKLLQKIKGITDNFFLFTLCVVSCWFLDALLMVTFHVQLHDLATQLAVIVVAVFVNVVVGYSVPVWARCLCFSMVPEEYLSTIDSCRFCSLCIGYILGFLTASLAYKQNSIYYPIIISGCMIEYIWLLRTKKRFDHQSKI